MSVALMGEVWRLDLRPSPGSRCSELVLRVVLLSLADHAHDDGTRCFPGISYTAWKCGLTRRQVQRALRALEHQQVIRAVRYASGGRGRATEFKIQLTKGVHKPPFEKGGHGTHKTATRGPQKDVPATAPTISNHQETSKACAPRNAAPADPRHRAIVETYIAEFERRHPRLKAPVNGSDGKALQELLRQQSTASTEELTNWLLNAFNSDDVPPLRPCFRLREFASHALKYTRGPLRRSVSRPSGALTPPPGKYHNLKPDPVV